MTVLEIIKIILYIISGAISVFVPCIIKIIRNVKTIKKAENEIDKEQAYNDLKEQMKIFIQGAEVAYEELNNMLKEKGQSAGPVKKDSVLLKLQAYADEHNYSFDLDLWSNEVDKEVKFAKNVNVNCN